MTRPPLLQLQHVLAGNVDSEAVAWLQHALRAWLNAGGSPPLHRYLGLPPATRIAVAVRDFWLAAAVIEVGLSSTRLHRAACDFENRTWPVWCHLESAPSSATVVEGFLFTARKAAPLPTSRRQFANILEEALGKRNTDNTSAPLGSENRRPPYFVTSQTRVTEPST